MSLVILAYGWYGRGNVGDELMKHALQQMFCSHNVELRFNSKIDITTLAKIDGILFGGGSILDGAPSITSDALQVLLSKQIPVFYVGIGPETAVHPVHQQLLKVAELVKYRDRDMSDLAYSLNVPDASLSKRSEAKGILLIPNVEVVPTHLSPHWMHIAWDRFKDEMAQVLDHFYDSGVQTSFMLMCSNDSMKDEWACSELIARMRRRGWRKQIYAINHDHVEACSLMTKHRVVITQRYHGIILAEMAGVPYIALEHHDKLKNVQPHRGQHISYYGATKAKLISEIEFALDCQGYDAHRVSPNTYVSIAQQVIGLARKRDVDH